MGDLRESKKRATRQRISDIATRLFFERGFDAVTVEEIAAAAEVSKMTVFNYFARKEDLLLDREDEAMQLLREAIRERPEGQSAIDALQGLVDRLREQKHPFAHIDSQTAGWLRVVSASLSLQARLREMQDEVVAQLALELGGAKPEGVTRLVAGLVVLTWRTAYGEALRVIEAGGSVKKANAAFVALIERGFDAVREIGVGAGPRSRQG